MKITDDVLTTKEAAKYLKVSQTQFYLMLKNGDIPYYNLADGNKKYRKCRFLRTDLITYLQSFKRSRTAKDIPNGNTEI